MSVGELHLDDSFVPGHQLQKLLFQAGVVRDRQRRARRAALRRPNSFVALVNRSNPTPSFDHPVDGGDGSGQKGLHDHRTVRSELELILVVDSQAGWRIE
jgi:hypothetical protein